MLLANSCLKFLTLAKFTLNGIKLQIRSDLLLNANPYFAIGLARVIMTSTIFLEKVGYNESTILL